MIEDVEKKITFIYKNMAGKRARLAKDATTIEDMTLIDTYDDLMKVLRNEFPEILQELKTNFVPLDFSKKEDAKLLLDKYVYGRFGYDEYQVYDVLYSHDQESWLARLKIPYGEYEFIEVTAETLFKEFVFDRNGTPCGKEVEE